MPVVKGVKVINDKRDYDTFEDSVKSIQKALSKIKSKKGFEEFMRPNKNNDISIEDISEETIKMVFENNPDKF